MRESFNFVGPNRTAAVESSAAHSMARQREAANEFHESELEKTPGERAAIDLLDDLLKREFEDLEIPEIPGIHAERFHIMSQEWFEKERPERNRGFYDSFKDSAVLCRDRMESALYVYKTIFHEGVHAVSHQKHWIDVGNRTIKHYRVGYGTTNVSRKEEEQHDHFYAFNEGVVESTVEELFYKYQEEIGRKLLIPVEELKGLGFSYGLFREVAQEICIGVALHDGVSRFDVWKKIKRGQFTGEMMHLRNIERVYGFEALDVLEVLKMEGEVEDVKDENAKKELWERNEKILEFFKNYDRPEEDRSDVRKKLMDEILGREQ